MAVFNPKDRIIDCKIVYYGPGRGGKTTNLDYLFQSLKKYTTGEMVSIDTKGDRTLFFDFVPMGLGKIGGCDVRVQLFTVPGQVRYNSTRKQVLKDVDGLVFVADSMEVQKKDNVWSLRNLQENLAEQNKSIYKVPIIVQYNKRDLKNDGIPLIPIKMMERQLNAKLKAPSYPASALHGNGVVATLKECLIRTLRSLNKELGWARQEARHGQ